MGRSQAVHGASARQACGAKNHRRRHGCVGRRSSEHEISRRVAAGSSRLMATLNNRAHRPPRRHWFHKRGLCSRCQTIATPRCRESLTRYNARSQTTLALSPPDPRPLQECERRLERAGQPHPARHQRHRGRHCKVQGRQQRRLSTPPQPPETSVARPATTGRPRSASSWRTSSLRSARNAPSGWHL